MSKFKTDIFKIFSKIDKGDMHIWENLSDDERKGFAPVVAQRWMTGNPDQRQLVFINELVNPMVFSIGKHPELLMKLMTVASSKKSKRYKWTSIKKSSKTNKKLSIQVISDYNNYSNKDSEEVRSLYTKSDIVEMAESLGWQKSEVSKLKRELR